MELTNEQKRENVMTEVGFKSDKGLKRTSNQDAFFVIPEESLFMIADGVGGNNSGEVASRTTISKTVEYVRKNAISKDFSEADIREYFTKCIQKINKDIYELSKIQPENYGMATTVTIVYVSNGIAYVTNVGDSRVYLYRDGNLAQITEDHTYVNALVNKGIITKEEAQFHEKKNVITKAIGGGEKTSPDFFCVDVKPEDIVYYVLTDFMGKFRMRLFAKLLKRAEACRKFV